MRKIKFRVWLPQLKKYSYNEGLLSLEGKLYGITRGNMIDGSQSLINIGSLKELNDYIIQQYTGLKDLNAREIYEGDIVNCKSDYSKLFNQIISYDNKNAAFKLSCGLLVGYSKDIEVMGNIFENKELLCTN